MPRLFSFPSISLSILSGGVPLAVYHFQCTPEQLRQPGLALVHHLVAAVRAAQPVAALHRRLVDLKTTQRTIHMFRRRDVPAERLYPVSRMSLPRRETPSGAPPPPRR